MAGKAAWFPTGGTLDDDVFARRHRTLRVLLALHVPVLGFFAWRTHQTLPLTLVALLPVVVTAVGSGFGSRALRGAVVAAGLAACSAVVVAMSGGIAESHYHALVMLAFIALYQDWVPFLGFILAASLGYVLTALTAPHALFDTPASNRPLTWAGVHVGFLVAEVGALVLFWRATEHEQDAAADVAADLARAELETTREQTEARQAAADLLANLARRNQELLDRQLQRIDSLEQSEQDPDALAELFGLDHLATRMRRNAESLLVLSGASEARPWGEPAPLSEICRGAMAEVEDYARVDVVLGTDVLIADAVVGDLVHLAAELIENATTFSPPTTRVLVSGNMTNSGYVFAVSDAGIGMTDSDLAAANATLVDPDARVEESSGMLGLHVVARLAARYGMRVWLQRGATGLSAMVALPPPCLVALIPAATAVEPAATAPAPAESVAAPVEAAPLAAAEPVPAALPDFVPAEPVAVPLEATGAFAPSAAPQAVPAQAEPLALPQPAVAAAPQAVPVQAESLGLPQPAVAAAPQAFSPLEPVAAPPVAAAPAPVAAAGPAPALTSAGLQRRVPAASLSAELAAGPAAGTHAPVEAPIEPEHARSVLSAYTGGAKLAAEAFSTAPAAFSPLEPAAAPVAAAPEPVPAEPAPAGPAPELTTAGLQRRVPRASLVAELAAGPDAGAHAPVEHTIEPTRARSVLSAYTGGAHAGREAADVPDLAEEQA